MGNTSNMGMTSCCEKNESEEETISRIISSMKLSELETENVYKDFLEILKENTIDRKSLNPFLNKIIRNNLYVKVQNDLVNQLIKDSQFNKDIKKLGIMVIIYSKNTQDESIKIHFMTSHFLKFYLDDYCEFNQDKIRLSVLSFKVEDFITDIIEIHTRNIILACMNFLSWERLLHLNEIWNYERKLILSKKIKTIYEDAIQKYTKNLSKSNKNTLDECEVLDRENENKNINRKFADVIIPQNFEIQFEKKIIEEIIKEFFLASLSNLKGEFIWNFLHEEYMHHKISQKSC